MTEQPPDPNPQTGAYESNLARLRLVVDQLERGSLSLDDSLKLFEEGMALSRVCDGQLTEVEERVKVLVLEHQELTPRKEIELETILVNPEGEP